MGFRSSDVPEEKLIPRGTRARARVESAEITKTKAAGDPMLVVRLRIVDGQFAGLSLFDQALMDHGNENAKRIGHMRVRDLSRAVGVPDWDQPSELAGRVCEIEVGIEHGRNGFAAKNIVSRYLASDGSAPPFVPPMDDNVPF